MSIAVNTTVSATELAQRAFTPKQIAFYSRVYRHNELTRYIAVAAWMFLFCEILDTIEDEIKHVWGSRWSFGRTMFHINRIWGPLTLAMHAPLVFDNSLPQNACVVMWLLEMITIVLGMTFVASILIARIWAVYALKPWIVVVMVLAYIGICFPSLYYLGKLSQASQSAAMTFVLGCPQKNRKRFPLNVTNFTLQTLLFVIAIYKPLRMKRKTMNTPLINHLIQSEVFFFGIMFPVLLLLALGTLSADMGLPMNNSGLLAAVSSSMCTRLILATRKWNNGTMDHSGQSLVDLDFRSPVVFRVPTPTEQVQPEGSELRHSSGSHELQELRTSRLSCQISQA